MCCRPLLGAVLEPLTALVAKVVPGRELVLPNALRLKRAVFSKSARPLFVPPL